MSSSYSSVVSREYKRMCSGDRPTAPIVQVAVRVNNKHLMGVAPGAENTEVDPSCVSIYDNECIRFGNDMKRSPLFTFDRVYREEYEVEEEMVFSDIVEPLIDDCCSRTASSNVSVLLYGEADSGKTTCLVSSQNGLIPRSLVRIFRLLSFKNANERRESSAFKFQVSLQVVELMNKDIMDLLVHGDAKRKLESNENELQAHVEFQQSPSSQPQIRPTLQRVGSESPQISGIVTEDVENVDEAMSCLNQGLLRRRSLSGSHIIISILIQQSYPGVEFNSKLNFVDLAAPQHLEVTHPKSIEFRDRCDINKSLMVLGIVISAIWTETKYKGSERSSMLFVPYRDSLLTSILKGSLGVNSKTVLIACISSALCDFEKTLDVLRFTYRIKNLKAKPSIAATSSRDVDDELDGVISIVSRSSSSFLVPAHSSSNNHLKRGYQSRKSPTRNISPAHRAETKKSLAIKAKIDTSTPSNNNRTVSPDRSSSNKRVNVSKENKQSDSSSKMVNSILKQRSTSSSPRRIQQECIDTRHPYKRVSTETSEVRPNRSKKSPNTLSSNSLWSDKTDNGTRFTTTTSTPKSRVNNEFVTLSLTRSSVTKTVTALNTYPEIDPDPSDMSHLLDTLLDTLEDIPEGQTNHTPITCDKDVDLLDALLDELETVQEIKINNENGTPDIEKDSSEKVLPWSIEQEHCKTRVEASITKISVAETQSHALNGFCNDHDSAGLGTLESITHKTVENILTDDSSKVQEYDKFNNMVEPHITSAIHIGSLTNLSGKVDNAISTLSTSILNTNKEKLAHIVVLDEKVKPWLASNSSNPEPGSHYDSDELLDKLLDHSNVISDKIVGPNDDVIFYESFDTAYMPPSTNDIASTKNNIVTDARNQCPLLQEESLEKVCIQTSSVDNSASPNLPEHKTEEITVSQESRTCFVGPLSTTYGENTEDDEAILVKSVPSQFKIEPVESLTLQNNYITNVIDEKMKYSDSLSQESSFSQRKKQDAASKTGFVVHHIGEIKDPGVDSSISKKNMLLTRQALRKALEVSSQAVLAGDKPTVVDIPPLPMNNSELARMLAVSGLVLNEYGDFALPSSKFSKQELAKLSEDDLILHHSGKLFRLIGFWECRWKDPIQRQAIRSKFLESYSYDFRLDTDKIDATTVENTDVDKSNDIDDKSTVEGDFFREDNVTQGNNQLSEILIKNKDMHTTRSIDNDSTRTMVISAEENHNIFGKEQEIDSNHHDDSEYRRNGKKAFASSFTRTNETHEHGLVKPVDLEYELKSNTHQVQDSCIDQISNSSIAEGAGQAPKVYQNATILDTESCLELITVEESSENIVLDTKDLDCDTMDRSAHISNEFVIFRNQAKSDIQVDDKVCLTAYETENYEVSCIPTSSETQTPNYSLKDNESEEFITISLKTKSSLDPTNTVESKFDGLSNKEIMLCNYELVEVKMCCHSHVGQDRTMNELSKIECTSDDEYNFCSMKCGDRSRGHFCEGFIEGKVFPHTDVEDDITSIVPTMESDAAIFLTPNDYIGTSTAHTDEMKKGADFEIENLLSKAGKITTYQLSPAENIDVEGVTSTLVNDFIETSVSSDFCDDSLKCETNTVDKIRKDFSLSNKACTYETNIPVSDWPQQITFHNNQTIDLLPNGLSATVATMPAMKLSVETSPNKNQNVALEFNPIPPSFLKNNKLTTLPSLEEMHTTIFNDDMIQGDKDTIVSADSKSNGHSTADASSNSTTHKAQMESVINHDHTAKKMKQKTEFDTSREKMNVTKLDTQMLDLSRKKLGFGGLFKGLRNKLKGSNEERQTADDDVSYIHSENS